MKDEYTAEDFARAVRKDYSAWFKDGKFLVEINCGDHTKFQEIEVETGRVLRSVVVDKDTPTEVIEEPKGVFA